MFLKSLELHGFKSFADKTCLEFSEGTTSLLGPNGCGKSNIVDAIKWVLGEQSTKTLRAGKMEDVIFNGTETRKSMGMAEVTLVICNEQRLLPTDHAEVEIKRRIYRNGESEFFINRAQVRLKDVRELFFDTGVGKSAYSILEQGKIDQILSHKPEDRRYVFEEAAGITRYKAKSVEARKKLERTEENIEQVSTLLSEIKRQYDSRKTQATKAARYRDLQRQSTELEVDVQLSAIQSLSRLREARSDELFKARQSYDEETEALKIANDGLDQKQQEVRVLADQRVAMHMRIQRLEEQIRASDEQLSLLQQRYRDFLRSRDEAMERQTRIREHMERDALLLEEKQENLDLFLQGKDRLDVEIHKESEALERARTTIIRNDQDMTEFEHEIQHAEQRRMELSLQVGVLVDDLAGRLEDGLGSCGYSQVRRNEKELLLEMIMSRIKSHLEGEAERCTHLHKLVEDHQTNAGRILASWQDGLRKSRGLFQEASDAVNSYRLEFPSFLDELTASDGLVSKKRALDVAVEECEGSIRSHRLSIEMLKDENKGLNQLMDRQRERLTELKVAAGEHVQKIQSTKLLVETLQRNMSEQNYHLDDALSDCSVANDRIAQTSGQMADVKEQQDIMRDERKQAESDLKQLAAVIENEHAKLSEERVAVSKRYDALGSMRTHIEKLTFHIESIGDQINTVYVNFFDTYGKSLKEYDQRLLEDIGDTSELREHLTEIKRQIQAMGYINHMAEQEFEEIKDRYDFLTKQMDDLIKARKDLDRVLGEIQKRSEELFLSSYEQIRTNFQEMFQRMFGGGRAELRLVDPEQILESGIEILVQPPGKKLDRLAPLSGGEKSLTAVALLFATYKVKPSPFCILDEIDAALDDRNIGYFLAVLDDFAKQSQFIIITHNKHTVMGSNTLLGVTMEERGVSKAIAWRLGCEAGKEVIHAQQVDIGLGNTV